MTKRADHSTRLDETTKHKQPTPAAAQTGKKDGDAREDKGELAENRRDLGVAEDHKTQDMEDQGRGTFP